MSSGSLVNTWSPRAEGADYHGNVHYIRGTQSFARFSYLFS